MSPHLLNREAVHIRYDALCELSYATFVITALQKIVVASDCHLPDGEAAFAHTLQISCNGKICQVCSVRVVKCINFFPRRGGIGIEKIGHSASRASESEPYDNGGQNYKRHIFLNQSQLACSNTAKNLTLLRKLRRLEQCGTVIADTCDYDFHLFQKKINCVLGRLNDMISRPKSPGYNRTPRIWCCVVGELNAAVFNAINNELAYFVHDSPFSEYDHRFKRLGNVVQSKKPAPVKREGAANG